MGFNYGRFLGFPSLFLMKWPFPCAEKLIDHSGDRLEGAAKPLQAVGVIHGAGLWRRVNRTEYLWSTQARRPVSQSPWLGGAINEPANRAYRYFSSSVSVTSLSCRRNSLIRGFLLAD